MLLKYFAIAGVVVDDQRAQADGLQPHLEPKCRTAIDFAVDTDLTAHQGGQLPANGKAETGAAVFACRERIGLAEGIEDMSLRLLGNADARIADLEAQQP